MASIDEWISARLRSVKDVARGIRLFEIAPDEGVMPYQPGSHIDVSVIVDGEQDKRSYSLVGEPNAETLSIAVKRLSNSRGGSEYMWSLKSGARLTISRAKNHFELSVGHSEYLLVAGGIGITPIYGMALSLLRRRSKFRLIYAAQSRPDMAFADHLREALGDRLELYPEDSHGRVDLATKIPALATDAEIYVCGPVGMLEAVKRCWRDQRRPQEKLRFETFGSTGHYPSEEFVVSIPHLRREFLVPRNRSLLETLEAEGIEMISNCRRGECGVCVVDILGVDSEIDHRDVFFSDSQKAEKRKMCTCVSRSRRTTCDRDGRPVTQYRDMPMPIVTDVSESRLQPLDRQAMLQVHANAASESTAMSEQVAAPPTYVAPPLFIAGEWRKGRGVTESPVNNPATGETLAMLSHASATDLDEALEASGSGFVRWGGTNAAKRAEIVIDASRLMRSRVYEIAPLLTLEQGKLLAQARAEILAAADMVQWYGEQSRRIYGRLVPSSHDSGELSVRYGPVGPCALFSPWNMPVLLASRKIGGALAAGCSAILKPAEETPAAIAQVVRCFVDAGLPSGVLNLVFGVPKDVSRHLLASFVIRKVSLTGSVGVGREIALLAAADFKRTTLELGGYAPVFVLPDADLDKAVEALVGAKFRNAGQLCLAPTRFLVHESVYQRFTASFVERTRKLRLGNGLDAAIDMGPLANARRRESVAALVDDAIGRGARALAGAAGEGRGFFYEPTVLVDVPDDARIRREEPFGPVAIIDSFKDLNAAIDAANATAFGLAGYAFTDSASAQKRIAEGLQVGVLAINNIAVSVAEAPFGGVKDSGFGRESGEEGLAEYLTTKTVHLA